MPDYGIPPSNAPVFPQGPQPPQLSAMQSLFLNLLSGAQSLGIGGTPVKLYNDVIQGGRTAPITESDLSQTELGQFKQMIQDKIAATGQPSGRIDYPDYMSLQPGARPSPNILGGFQFNRDPTGVLNIKDVYDFNANRAGPAYENNPVLQALAMAFNPRGLAAQIGRQVRPDIGGQGVPVNINLR